MNKKMNNNDSRGCRMKKILVSILTVGMLVFAGSAMACNPTECPGNYSYYENTYLFNNGYGIVKHATETLSWTQPVTSDLTVPPDTINYAKLTISGWWDSGNGLVKVEGVAMGQLNPVTGFWGWSSTVDIGNIFSDGWLPSDNPLNISITLLNYSAIQFTQSDLEICYQNGTNAVPEPATMLLLGFGLAGVAYARKRFKK